MCTLTGFGGVFFIFNQDEAERWDTYVQVRYSGVQDKQREISTSVLSIPSDLTAPSAEALLTAYNGGPLPLEVDPFSYLEDIKKYTEYQMMDMSEVISALESVLRVGQGSDEDIFKHLKDNQTFQGLVKFLKDVPQEKRAQLIKAISDIATSSHLENHHFSTNSPKVNGNSRRREHVRALLLEISQYHASENIVVYGLQDIEDVISPFYFASLHDGQDKDTDRFPIYKIDGSFDPNAPIVMKVAALKGDEREQRRFLNAVWWAVQKVKLRETPVDLLLCSLSDIDNKSDKRRCNFDELIQGIAVMIGHLKKDVGRM